MLLPRRAALNLTDPGEEIIQELERHSGVGRLVHATETVASVGVGAWQQRQSKLARFRKLRCVVNTFEEAISRAAPDSGHARALFLGERAAPRAVLHAMSLAGAIGLHVLISLKIQCTVNLVVCSSRRFLPRVWMLELDNQKTRARGVFWLATDRFDECVKSQVPGKSKALGRWIYWRLNGYVGSAGDPFRVFLAAARHPTSA